MTLAIGALSVGTAIVGHAVDNRRSYMPAEASAFPLIQTTTPTPAPTPVTTVVPPETSTVEPNQTIVTPESSIAQAESGPALVDQDDGPPFTVIGIAAGVGAAALVLISGIIFRAVRRRPEAD